MESNPIQVIPNKTQTFLPSTPLTYLDPNYWNGRFSEEEHYEWLKDYSHFRHLIIQHIPLHSSVLELGCGNSQLSDEMYKDGIKNITCSDLSPIAVEKMKRRFLCKGYIGIKTMVADMLNLPFEDEAFDVIIEKGTTDVLFVDSGDPWNPNPETVSKVTKMLRGIHRVLKPDGVFISISFGQPHFRRPIFEGPEFTWSMEYTTFGDGFHYFFYTMNKGTRSLNAAAQQSVGPELPRLCLFQDELEGEDFIFRTAIDGDDEN